MSTTNTNLLPLLAHTLQTGCLEVRLVSLAEAKAGLEASLKRVREVNVGAMLVAEVMIEAQRLDHHLRDNMAERLYKAEEDLGRAEEAFTNCKQRLSEARDALLEALAPFDAAIMAVNGASRTYRMDGEAEVARIVCAYLMAFCDLRSSLRESDNGLELTFTVEL